MLGNSTPGWGWDVRGLMGLAREFAVLWCYGILRDFWWFSHLLWKFTGLGMAFLNVMLSGTFKRERKCCFLWDLMGFLMFGWEFFGSLVIFESHIVIFTINNNNHVGIFAKNIKSLWGAQPFGYWLSLSWFVYPHLLQIYSCPKPLYGPNSRPRDPMSCHFTSFYCLSCFFFQPPFTADIVALKHTNLWFHTDSAKIQHFSVLLHIFMCVCILFWFCLIKTTQW